MSSLSSSRYFQQEEEMDRCAADLWFRLCSSVRTVYLCSRQVAVGRQRCPTNVIWPQWDGGKDRFGRTHNRPMWGRIVRVVLEKNLNFERLVVLAFDGYQKDVVPNKLIDPTILAQYQEYVADGIEETTCHITSLLENVAIPNYCSDGPLPTFKEVAHATNALVNLAGQEPLLVYSVGCNYPMLIAPKPYHELALLNYFLNAAEFEIILGNRWPITFRQEIVELRQRMLEKGDSREWDRLKPQDMFRPAANA